MKIYIFEMSKKMILYIDKMHYVLFNLINNPNSFYLEENDIVLKQVII